MYTVLKRFSPWDSYGYVSIWLETFLFVIDRLFLILKARSWLACYDVNLNGFVVASPKQSSCKKITIVFSSKKTRKREKKTHYMRGWISLHRSQNICEEGNKKDEHQAHTLWSSTNSVHFFFIHMIGLSPSFNFFHPPFPFPFHNIQIPTTIPLSVNKMLWRCKAFLSATNCI